VNTCSRRSGRRSHKGFSSLTVLDKTPAALGISDVESRCGLPWKTLANTLSDLTGIRDCRLIRSLLIPLHATADNQNLAERTDECSLTGRLNRWRMRSVCGRRKNPYEFDCDQRQEHEQVNSQGPKRDPHSAGHFDTWHILFSASNKSLHYIPRMNDS
jgi:hypothetical protein